MLICLLVVIPPLGTTSSFAPFALVRRHQGKSRTIGLLPTPWFGLVRCHPRILLVSVLVFDISESERYQHARW